jgi:uncharacterized protein
MNYNGAMRSLIDGYNLMHFLGLVRPRGPKSLEKSRLDLQAWLRKTHAKQIGDVTVVFDGREATGQPPIQQDHELRIHFAIGETADDLILELIRREAQPRRLTVVSSDRRIREAARRRECIAWDCSEYLDWALEQGHEAPRPAPEPEKPALTEEETERWKKEFADLDSDPELRKFNRMYEDFREG